MRKILLFTLLLSLTAAWMVGCGDSKKVVVAPITSNAFAFMQEVALQGYTFTPMVGQYVTTGNSTRFEVAVPTDSSTGKPVTEDFGSIYLSRSGKTATFDMWDKSVEQWDIYVAQADGSAITQITNDTYEDFYPQLSPNGSQVAFTSQREGDLGMTYMTVVRNVANPMVGEQILPMPLGAYETWAPTFSPDGSKIAVGAYGQNEVNGWFDGIVLMNADGSSPQLLTNPYATCECWDDYPAFTPDGSKIVFNGGGWDVNNHYFADVYTMNPDGTGVTQLTDGVGYSLDPLVIRVSGVGDKIVFYSDRDNLNATATTGFELYSMNLDGSGLARLTANGLFDGFSAEWFDPQGTAKTAKPAVARHTPAHRATGGVGAPHSMHGLKW